jgi:hypothetical protein
VVLVAVAAVASGVQRQPIGVARLIGLVLLIAGVALVVRK